MITADPNYFLSMFSEGLFFLPNCVKMSMKAHPDYLKPEKRWLAFKFEGSPPFLPVCEGTRLLRHFEHFTRGMVQGTSYGHVTP